MRHLTRHLAVISRCMAALLGGYGLVYYAAAALAVILPGPRSEAAVIAMLLGLLIYAAAVMWAFSARSAARAWLGLAVSTSICIAIVYVPGMLA